MSAGTTKIGTAGKMSPRSARKMTAAGAATRTLAVEHTAKHISENVTHIRTGEIKASEASCSATASVFKSSVAKLVVLSSLVRVT